MRYLSDWLSPGCTVILWVALFIISVSGCESQSGLAAAAGTVKLDGRPLPDALVEFIPQNGSGVVSMGRTDRNGNYSMMASRSAEGATVGTNKVRITTFEILDEGGKQQVVQERVPTKYNSQTELSVTVEASGRTEDENVPCRHISKTI